MTSTAQARHDPAGAHPVVVVMGVAGSGKSTVGRALAAAWGWAFRDADDDHPPENVAAMARGEALDDAMREPWLAALAARIERHRRDGPPLVLACSALKEAYRARLRVGGPVRFVYLCADRRQLVERLRARRGHFFAADLLDSQFADLEPPRNAIEVDAHAPVADIVADVEAAWTAPGSRR